MTSNMLDSLGLPENSRDNIPWKVYSNDGTKFMMVSQSSNWVEA